MCGMSVFTSSYVCVGAGTFMWIPKINSGGLSQPVFTSFFEVGTKLDLVSTSLESQLAPRITYCLSIPNTVVTGGLPHLLGMPGM